MGIQKLAVAALAAAQASTVVGAFLQSSRAVSIPVSASARPAPLFSSLANDSSPVNSLKFSQASSHMPGLKLSTKKGPSTTSRKNESKAMVLAALASIPLLLNGLNGGPFAVTAVPYAACLLWGLPSTKIGSWKSAVSVAHRLGGIATLLLPLILSAYHAATGLPANLTLYFATVATAAANLGFGGALITRRVPGYDIPTLRAFAVGVSLGLAFLGHSLLFVLGKYNWYWPIGSLFCGVSIYSAIFAWSDALQHAWMFLSSGKKRCSNNMVVASPELSTTKGKEVPTRPRFWHLPFEKPKLQDIFVRNLWRQPTQAALNATVSPANGVVVFTTGMTALFASLSLLQLRYLFLGPAGMAKLFAAEPAFFHWSALQALLAVVANNFGTFAGTLVIQRRTSQKQAGIFNAIGLLVPVLNIVAFLALNPAAKGADVARLMLLPSV